MTNIRSHCSEESDRAVSHEFDVSTDVLIFH